MHKGNNFFHKVKYGRALAAQSVGQATVNGETIVEPWKHGRQLSFFLIGGAISATAANTIVVEGRVRADSTWETIVSPVDDADVEFDDANLNNADLLETDSLLGTIDLSRVDGERYNALRISITQATSAQTTLIAAGYLISDLYRHPSGSVDYLFSQLVPE